MTSFHPDPLVSELVGKWVSLGRKYAEGVEGMTAIYICVIAEYEGKAGSISPSIAFEVNGKKLSPEQLGVDDRFHTRIRYLFDGVIQTLRDAREKMLGEGVEPPSEFLIRYDVASDESEVHVRHGIRYAYNDNLEPSLGLIYWLGKDGPKSLWGLAETIGMLNTAGELKARP